MANRKQLAILKQGVAAWNKWREENPDAKINLRGAKLDDLDLSGANFFHADIRGTSFRKAVLAKAIFSKSNAGCSLIGIIYQILLIILSIINVSVPFIGIYILSETMLQHLIDIYRRNSLFLCVLHVFGNPYFALVQAVVMIFLLLLITRKILHEEQKVSFVCKTVLFTFSIFGTDFQETDLTEAIFNNATLKYSRFCNAIMNGTSFKDARGLQLSRCNGTILEDRDVRELLVRGNGHSLSLKGKKLQGAHLVNADLRSLDLRETDLMQANLSGANITGAKLWGSARENWIIDGIRCDYVYWDEAGEQRTPPDRDFRPGEFEELYKQLPTFEYIFEQGFTPLDPLIMDRVVQAINKQHEEFQLTLINFDKRGQPHATFTVCHLEHVEKAKQQIAAGYEESRIAPEQQAQLMTAFLGLIENQSKLIDKIPSPRELTMGDTYNISGGQIGAVGQSASASGNTFQQITTDLSRLHEEMERSAKTPEQRAAAEDVAKAAQAAREQNEPAMLQHLKNAGRFALDCAKTVGTDVAAEYLKKIAEL